MSENNNKKLVSSTPHVRSEITTQKIMADVIIALLPAVFAGIYFFGIRAGFVLAVSVFSAVCFEALYQRITKQIVTVWDLSAVITGLLLGMNLPASAPLWMPVVGSFFAIVIVKQLFGGLGQNFINPALAARAFLLASYPARMTAWTAPVTKIFSLGADAVTTATPLALLKAGAITPATQDYLNAFLGNIGGCIGETSALALIIGGIYLLYRKVITWHAPVTYIITATALTFILGRNGFMTGYPFYEILTGGLLLGAIFMITDYSTSPVSGKGRIVMGLGCGVLTALIRVYGGYPEGVSYSILIMNLVVPLIDRYIRPRVFGVQKKKKEA